MVRLAGGKLEGHEIMDIVEGLKNSVPRVVQLKDSGRGWVDFIRRIGALTLFGNGFGDLITPLEGSNTLCKEWEKVPSNHDLLVAPRSVLRDLHHGSHRGELESFIVTSRMLLHAEEQLFGNCKCDHLQGKSCCRRLQAWKPRPQKLPPNSKINEHLFKQKNGAIIFGKGNLNLAGSSRMGKADEEGPSQELSVITPPGGTESQQDSTLLSSQDEKTETSFSSPPSTGMQSSLGFGARTPSTSMRVPSGGGTARTETSVDISVREHPRDQVTEKLASEVQRPSTIASQSVRLGHPRSMILDKAKRLREIFHKRRDIEKK
jgi:hypothetical protein